MEPIIVEKKVVPVYRNILCPHCNTNMLRNGFNILTFPPIVTYICSKCGYSYESSNSYPIIEWHIVDDDGNIGEQIVI